MTRAALVALALGSSLVAARATGQPPDLEHPCGIASLRCHDWRREGGFLGHQRDLSLNLGLGLWGQDGSAGAPIEFGLRGVVLTGRFKDAWLGGGGGVRAVADAAGGVWGNPVFVLGAYLRTPRDGTRLALDLDLTPFDRTGEIDASPASALRAQHLMIGALGMGATDDLARIHGLASGWLLRVGVYNRFAFFGATRLTIDLDITAGAATVAIPSFGTRPGSSEPPLRREVFIGAGHLQVLVGETTHGLRFGLRFHLGYGAVLPAQIALPMALEAVLGIEPDHRLNLELAAGAGFVPADLDSASPLHGASGLHVMLRTRIFPVGFGDRGPTRR